MELALKGSGKRDAYLAIHSAKRHLWKLLMHLWCTLQWLCDRIDEIQEMWDRADQMMAQDKCFFEIHCFYLSLVK